MKKLRTLLFLLPLLLIPNIFSNTLEINMLSSYDRTNSFYLSNNHTKEIDFRVSFFEEDFKEGKLVFSSEILPSSSEVSLVLSTEPLYFYNDFNTTEKISINTKTLTEIKTIQLKAEVYDKFENLVYTKAIYFKIIPNNSDDYFIYTEKHNRPKLIGYSLSRTVAIINKNNTDKISVYIKAQEGNSNSLICNADNNITINYNYINKEQTDLIFSISKDKTIKEGDYKIECYLQDGYEKINLKEIKLIVEEQEKATQTALVALSKEKSFLDSKKLVFFFFVLIVFFLLITFSKK